MGQPRLLVILASTRPGRVGLPVANWFLGQAEQFGAFDIELADLAEWNLPFMDEPKHPRLRQYTQDHTRRWSATVEAADAIVWVMPEYNHGYTAPLKNAVDYLIHEWAYKPVGFVSYGGLSAGSRAVQQLKPVLSDLKMLPLPDGVLIPYVSNLINDGVFEATDSLSQQAQVMLAEMERLVTLLSQRRAAAAQPRA